MCSHSLVSLVVLSFSCSEDVMVFRKNVHLQGCISAAGTVYWHFPEKKASHVCHPALSWPGHISGFMRRATSVNFNFRETTKWSLQPKVIKFYKNVVNSVWSSFAELCWPKYLRLVGIFQIQRFSALRKSNKTVMNLPGKAHTTEMNTHANDADAYIKARRRKA